MTHVSESWGFLPYIFWRLQNDIWKPTLEMQAVSRAWAMWEHPVSLVKTYVRLLCVARYLPKCLWSTLKNLLLRKWLLGWGHLRRLLVIFIGLWLRRKPMPNWWKYGKFASEWSGRNGICYTHFVANTKYLLPNISKYKTFTTKAAYFHLLSISLNLTNRYRGEILLY